jgi:energy-coupling factor transporter ATP-binding protein EcfA2
MLAMGRALMTDPRLLMMDEPSMGLAPLVVRDIFRAVVRLREEGRTVLLVEQNARAALRIAAVLLVISAAMLLLERKLIYFPQRSHDAGGPYLGAPQFGVGVQVTTQRHQGVTLLREYRVEDGRLGRAQHHSRPSVPRRRRAPR